MRSLVVVSDIECDLTEILIQRLTYRINRYIKPLFLIIITDEQLLSSRVLEILGTLTVPYMVMEDPGNTPFFNLIPKELPSLNSTTFPYLLIDMDTTVVKTEHLKMDESLKLIDNHIHTELAWCSENMDLKRNIELAKIFGLHKITITEHSGHLYFAKGQHAERACYTDGLDIAKAEHYRVEQYLKMKELYQSDFVRFGLELDFDFDGKPVIEDGLLEQFDFILGSMHQLEEITEECFLKQLKNMLEFGVDVVAHPLRIFPRYGLEAPQTLFKTVVELFKQYDTAVELNFHSQQPPKEFVKLCLDEGVRFSFGSDSHNLAEIGDFYYQLSLLKNLQGDVQFSQDVKLQ